MPIILIDIDVFYFELKVLRMVEEDSVYYENNFSYLHNLLVESGHSLRDWNHYDFQGNFLSNRNDVVVTFLSLIWGWEDTDSRTHYSHNNDTFVKEIEDFFSCQLRERLWKIY